MRLHVDVQHASGAWPVPDDGRVARWAQAAAAAFDRDAELSVRFVDGEEGAALNASYRGGSGATNVLSFPFEARDRTEPPLLGDVVVCAPVVAREAAEQDKPLEAHYAHMVVHGVLHLLGHEHERDEDAARMEGVERDVLAGLGFADPYAGRAP